ncbi:MAG: hypothetical protein JW829_08915 [Pirellulales bacterium]|nr:hypothetical protein [Pirellulales bacterium]
MRCATLENKRLGELIHRFPDCRIAVLGDFFLDKYLDVDPALVETSVETGNKAHQVVRVRCSPGAAGTIVNNLSALGANHLHTIGLVGDDGEGFELRRGLENRNCNTRYLICAPDIFTPTYLKPRNQSIPGLAGEHERYDTKLRNPIPDHLENQIVNALDALLPEIDALIVLDQVESEEADSSILSPTVRNAIIQRIENRPDLIAWVDSRCYLDAYRHLIIKCNHYEVLGLRQPPPGTTVDEQGFLDAAKRLRTANQAPVVVTCGEYGAVVSDPEWTRVPGVHIEGEIDSTGAGDSFSAGTVLALGAGASLPEAAVVGNLVASITVQHLGSTGVARPDQLEDRLRLWNQQQKG